MLMEIIKIMISIKLKIKEKVHLSVKNKTFFRILAGYLKQVQGNSRKLP
jgi:hypothetical protein